MKTITQYKEDIRTLMAKSAEIDAKCVAENRDLTEAERTYKNEIMDTVNEYQDIVKTMERQERIASELETPDTPLTVPENDKKGSGIKVLGDRAEKDRFHSPGEQFMAIKNAGMPGGRVDPRLRNIQDAATGLNESVPSDGGFLVQKDYSTLLLQDLFETGGLWTKVGMRIPITGDSNGTVINGVDETSRASTTWGGITVGMIGEGSQLGSSKPKFRRIELNLKKIGGLCYATDENLSDSAQLESIIRRGFASGFGFKLDDLLLNGVGGGEPVGFLQGGSLVTVDKEIGQSADTIMAENVIKMYSRMFASSLGSAAWLINQNTLPQLLTMSLSVGTGGVPVYLPPGNTLINAPGGALLGRPVFPIEQCQSIGTLGDIIFVDVANGYVVAEKGGLKTDMSIHLRFDYDEVIFRFILRIDGQPVRASALTPSKGGSDYDQSHCIALETRS